ncbi:lysozyme, partial [Salmonella enterica subsp. enterica serovar Java]|nr:lysozyme [Salmonella enterica subsp. enterica serovar Java]ECL6613660.1 lysozyme [Salmonella enterica]ECP9764562.1 lysozyme [Salmonella enterica]HAD2339641.1 lysozyme [Salmonella enterica subsp. enterica serovar Typhimurium]
MQGLMMRISEKGITLIKEFE